jgi:3-oxoacyl-(acyl-carrier-protein) synthase
MPREVWITGVGIVSAVGTGIAAHAEAARASRSGLSHRSFFGGAAPDPCLVGMAPADIVSPVIEDTPANRADSLLDHALRQCMTDAHFEAGCAADLIAGTTLGNIAGATNYYRAVRTGAEADLSLIRHMLPCAAPLWAAKRNNIKGRCLAVSSACGSGMAAIGHAFRRVAAGHCDRVFAGGFDALSPFVVAGFNSLRLVSKRECRPFDRDRDGLSPGEGAAMLLVESKESALARNAQPLARLTGFGDALDAYHHTRAHPEGLGLQKAMTAALTAAGSGVEEIDHVHLHGTGTVANDASEYQAYKTVFGNRLSGIPACSTKSMTGHTFGAAGAIGAVFSIISLQWGLVPPTLFLENKDPAFSDLNAVQTSVARPEIRMVMCTALGFGGESFALILSKAGR